MGKTATLNLRVDEELKIELGKIAKQHDRSPSYIAEQAIRDRIAFEQAQVRAILAQAELGEVVPHGDVKAWIDSWDTDDELDKPGSNSTT